MRSKGRWQLCHGTVRWRHNVHLSGELSVGQRYENVEFHREPSSATCRCGWHEGCLAPNRYETLVRVVRALGTVRDRHASSRLRAREYVATHAAIGEPN